MSNENVNNSKSWSYQVIIDPSFQNGDFGHAILQISSPSGEKLAAGFYPSRSADSTNLPDFTGIHHAVEAPGHVRYENEETTYPEYSFVSKPRIINEDTAHKLIDYVSERVDNPGRYEVWNHNCVDFVERGMVIAGDRLSIQDAKTPFMLMYQIKAQEAAEEIFDKTKKSISDLFKDSNGTLNPNWFVVALRYIQDKEIIHQARADPGATAAGIGRLTEIYAKNIDEFGLENLASKIKNHELSIRNAGEAIEGRGY